MKLNDEEKHILDEYEKGNLQAFSTGCTQYIYH